MPSALPITEHEWRYVRAGGGIVTATQVVGQAVIHLDRSQEPPLPAGAMLLSSFLDEFEAHEDIASLLPDARRNVATEIAALSEGPTLRDLRLRTGRSQAEVAEALGTSQSRVSRLESRRDKPSEDTMRGLCRILDVDANTLFEALARAD